MSGMESEHASVSDEREREALLESRVAMLEAQMVALNAAIVTLRNEKTGEPAGPAHGNPGPSLSPQLAARLREPPYDPPPPRDARPSFVGRVHAGTPITGADLESLVGRYATLALAALVILMAVGAVIKMAVERGLLTPEVRVAAGVLAAVSTGIAGWYFRRRGDVRYGNVLLAIALAVVDLVAWGAGPRLHLVPTGVALAVVDVVAIAFAALALLDGSEFLFAVSVAGALSAPFVTADGGGSALVLLLYGGVALAGALRAARDPAWTGAIALLLTGAFVYAIAASQLPASAAWYGPHLVTLFAGCCAAAALVIGERAWRSELPRGYLVAALIGTFYNWPDASRSSLAVSLAVSVAVAAVTYSALLVRGVSTRLWTLSALLLPAVSLAIATSETTGGETAAVLGLWAAFSMLAWQLEERAGEKDRGGVHLLAASLLGGLAVTAWLWATPLAFVAGLSTLGVIVALLCRNLQSEAPLYGVLLATGASSLFAIDQLASRSAYAYTPFTTRSSASALCAAVGLDWRVLFWAAGRGRVPWWQTGLCGWAR